MVARFAVSSKRDGENLATEALPPVAELFSPVVVVRVPTIPRQLLEFQLALSQLPVLAERRVVPDLESNFPGLLLEVVLEVLVPVRAWIPLCNTGAANLASDAQLKQRQSADTTLTDVGYVP